MAPADAPSEPAVVVDRAAEAWFASDLHLDDDRPALTSRFVAAVQALPDGATGGAGSGPALFLLGDLFEFWIGDDHRTDASQALAAALRTLAERGWRIYLLRGNRDFLLGESFAGDCGARLLHEPVAIDVGHRRIALAHGDAECLDDLRYQQWRALSRSSAWQHDFLAQPVAARLALARAARAASLAQRDEPARESSAASAADTDRRVEGAGDLSPTAVAALLDRFGAVGLVHGHTHRPALHEEADGRWRWVLPDWREAPPRGRIMALSEVLP